MKGFRWIETGCQVWGLGILANSHTASVKVDFTDPDILRRAVEAMQGQWLGKGSHRLFAGDVCGHGFSLPNWRYPLVLDPNGSLLYDDYGGSWGKVSDIDLLKSAYAIECIASAAHALGWLYERQGEILIVHHPSGGQLCYAGGQIETTGFTGSGCHEAREQLGLEKLGLHAENVQLKPEYGQVAASVQLPS